MADLIQNAVLQFFLTMQRLIASLLGFLCDLFTFDEFTPELTRFNELFGGTEKTLPILEVFRDIGWVIAGILFVVTCITYMFGNAIEIKDSIIGCLGRVFVAIILCTIIDSFLVEAVTFGTDIGREMEVAICEALCIDGLDENLNPDWSEFIFISAEGNTVDLSDEDNPKIEGGLLDNTQITGVYNMYSDAYATSSEEAATMVAFYICLVGALFHIVIYMIIIYFFAKLCFELVRRYMVYGALTMISPSIPGFLTTSDSAQVFSNFIKMYGTQIGLIILTRIWIILSLCAMANVKTGIIEAFMIIAFISIGVQMERYAKDLGLTVTGQGMALLDSVVMTSTIALRSIGGVAKGVGGAMIIGGSFAGATGVVKFGSILSGRPADDSSVLRTMQGNFGGVARETLMKKGVFTGPSNSEKATLSKLAGSGFSNNRDVNGFLATLSPEARKEALQHLLDTNYAGINDYLKENKGGLYLESTGNEFINGKGMAVQLIDPDDGKAYRNGFINSVAQADDAIAFTGSNGEQLYFNPVGEGLQNEESFRLGKEGELITDEPTSGELKYGFELNREQLGFMNNKEGNLETDYNANHYQVDTHGDEQFLLHNEHGTFGENSKSPVDTIAYKGRGMELTTPKNNVYENTYSEAKTNAYNNARSQGISSKDAKKASITAGENALKDKLNDSNGFFKGTNLEVTSVKMNQATGVPTTAGKMHSFTITTRNKTSGEEKKFSFKPAVYNVESANRNNTKDGMIIQELKQKKQNRKK